LSVLLQDKIAAIIEVVELESIVVSLARKLLIGVNHATHLFRIAVIVPVLEMDKRTDSTVVSGCVVNAVNLSKLEMVLEELIESKLIMVLDITIVQRKILGNNGKVEAGPFALLKYKRIDRRLVSFTSNDLEMIHGFAIVEVETPIAAKDEVVEQIVCSGRILWRSGDVHERSAVTDPTVSRYVHDVYPDDLSKTEFCADKTGHIVGVRHLTGERDDAKSGVGRHGKSGHGMDAVT